MKILHTVEFYQPVVGGMQEVVRQLSERLVKLGHDVTVATSEIRERVEDVINGVRIAEFAIRGNAVGGMSGEVEKYRDFLVGSDFDIIANFAAQQWATDIMLQSIDDVKAKKVFVPTGFSGLFLPQYRAYFEAMKVWMKRYDMNIFLSNDYRDINFARSHGVEKLTVIPNGAGADEFLPEPDIAIRNSLAIPDDHFLILHVGSHTGAKGHSEAVEIFKRSRLKNATLLLVANDSGGGCARSCARKARLLNLSPARMFNGKRLINVSLSRRETVAAYKAAELFLFPSNIECSPLVLFECMASMTPFLTTDVGNAKEIIEWSGAGMMLPTFKDAKGYSHAEIGGSALMLEELYHSPEKRKSMQASGFEAWKERFTWEDIALDYQRVYNGLLLH